MAIILVAFAFSPDYAQNNANALQSVMPTNTTMKQENPSHTISITYHDNWKIVTANDTGIRLVSAGSPPANFSIDASPFTAAPLIQLAATYVNSYKEKLTNFKLNDSAVTGNDKIKVVYSYQQGAHQVKVMRLWISAAGKVYHIVYSSELKNYSHYLPDIQKIIGSLHIQSAPRQTTATAYYPGLRTGADPWDITVNPATDIIYIANRLSNTISVLDGSTDRILATIDSGSSPTTVTVNPTTKRLYVANSGSNTVSVFDTSNNKKLAEINVGKNPVDLAIDSLSGGLNSLTFVANSGSDTVSVVNGLTNTVVKNITVGHEPQALSVNMLTKKLYVANSGSNTVSIIDYFISQSGQFKNTSRTDISVGSFPIAVNIDSNTNRLYTVSSVIDGIVSVINASTLKKIRDISVGSFPMALYVNPKTQMIYVTNAGSGTVSVIDGSTFKKNDIAVGGSPLAVFFNPDTGILYVTNTASPYKVSEISGNKLLVGINFDIKPSSAGNIECDPKVPNNYFIRVGSGVPLSCNATTNRGFLFSSWTSNLSHSNNTVNNTKFKASDFGNITANYIQPVQVSLPKEFWEGFSSNLMPVIILPIAAAIATWFIPAIAGWINGWRQRQNLRRYMKDIIKMHTIYHSLYHLEDSKYTDELEKKRNEISKILTEGKISESQYTILDKKISDYEEEIRNNKK
jgi:YVTN family beta-propeller protein